ncbi:MAG: helix-turn-helix transcriptional regulator [Candidatus Competibacter denitrificans]|jgi:transcriptional regulator with XRE-family HTH domain
MSILYKHTCFIVNKKAGLNSYKRACSLESMDMADRLKARRKQMGLTQVELAQKASMTQQMIQQLETRKVLTTGKLVQLADALGVRPQWLESGAEPMVESMTMDEREFLEAYRAMNQAEKEAARLLLRRTAKVRPAIIGPPPESRQIA